MTRSLSLLAFALVLAACDSTAPSAVADADLDDAAVVLASAVAIDGGGLLEDAAAAAALSTAPDGAARHPADRLGCAVTRVYDGSGTWNASVDCERGNPDGRFYASFERTSTYRFLGAEGQPQEERRGAVTIEHAVLSGASLFRTPRATHELISLTTDLAVDDVQSDLVTVNGTVQRAASSALSGPRGERTLDYQLDATLTDVQGPRSAARRWRAAVDGTVSGTLQATITRTPAGGETSTVVIDQAFEITFPVVASGDRIAQIVIGGRRYRADVDSGAVEGLDG